MVEAGKRIFEINRLLDTLIRDILVNLKGLKSPLDAEFPHYGNMGYRIVKPVAIAFDGQSESVSIETSEGESIPWEELGVSVKDFIANTIVLRLMSDARLDRLNQ